MEDLTLSITGGNDITVDIPASNPLTGSITNFTASENFYGSETFTAIVSDGEFSNSQVFTVTVNPINDAPVLNQVSDIAFDEDTSYSFDLYASDIEDDALTYSLEIEDGYGATLNESTITISPDSNQFYSCLLYTSDAADE